MWHTKCQRHAAARWMARLVSSAQLSSFSCRLECVVLFVDTTVPLLRSDYSVAGRRPCECENQPIDPTCGMTPFPTVPIWMQPCSPPICKVQGDDPKTACNPATCTYTTCKSPSPTPARACSAALKSHCGDAKKRGSVECDICVDFHSRQLSKASCTKAQLGSFCGGSSGI